MESGFDIVCIFDGHSGVDLFAYERVVMAGICGRAFVPRLQQMDLKGCTKVNSVCRLLKGLLKQQRCV